MSTSPDPATPGGPCRLAARLARSVLEGTGQPVLAGVPEPGLGSPVVAPLGDRHPLELLLGARAPDHWEAVIVVAAGSVRAGVLAGGDTEVVVATVTGRSGPDRSVVLDHQGRCVVAAVDAEGLIPDAARRFMARPTPPPDHPVTAWWAGEWLAEVADLVADMAGASPSPSGCPLEAVVACHPAVDEGEVRAMRGTPELVGFLVERGFDHAHLTGWDGVRQSVAAGLIHQAACPAPLAQWFDAGSFSRYATALRPPPEELLRAIEQDLGPATASAVERILGAWRARPR